MKTIHFQHVIRRLLLLGALTLTSHCTAQSLFFEHLLVPIGDQPPDQAETAELHFYLVQYQSGNQSDALLGLESFATNHPASSWLPSLHSDLGFHYRQIGRDTLALQHWEAAWNATGTAQSGPAKAVADFTLAHWTRLLASLGRYETLTAILQDTRGRVLDRGPLSQMWARTGEAIAQMRLRPGISYSCGTFALYEVSQQLGINYDARTLLKIPSPSTGFSMKTLVDFSAQFGLGLVPAVREAGVELVVPSVIHWRQNHYAAIVAREGSLYRVIDPTFGRPRYLTADNINAEASGNFMVRGNQIPSGYRALSPNETAAIFGRGNPNFFGDANDQPTKCPLESPPGSDGPGGGPPGLGGPGLRPGGGSNPQSSCSSCSGMPVWRVSEPYINLWLEDEPIGYQPPLGPRVSFQLSYKQRLETSLPSNFSSVGQSWVCPWLSGIEANWYYTYGQFLHFNLYDNPPGALTSYDHPEATASGYFNSLKLLAQTNNSGVLTNLEVLYPNGAMDVYGFRPTNVYGGGTWYYLTRKVSADGQRRVYFMRTTTPTVSRSICGSSMLWIPTAEQTPFLTRRAATARTSSPKSPIRMVTVPTSVMMQMGF